MEKDLRVIKTKRAIENSFIQLVEERGYENVRLVDIAKKAEVNRNTIYLHYESKEDIVESIVLGAYQDEIDKLQINEYLKMKNNRKKIQSMFEIIFTGIEEKIDLFRIMLTDENLAGYVERLMFNIKKYILSTLVESKKNEIIVNYIVFGVYGIIRNWVVYATGTNEENIKIITDLVCQCARKMQFR